MKTSFEKIILNLLKNMRMLNVWIVQENNISLFTSVYTPQNPPKPGDVIIVYRKVE